MLVVEDNVDSAESFQMLIGILGPHTVRVAHHGLDALRLIDEFVPDVAFMDLGLPEITGFDLASRFRADPRTRQTMLVAVTGYGRDEDKDAARRAGFDHHLTKPVDPDVVAALLTGFGTTTVPADRSSTLVH